jgi:hypothetical protein
LEDVSDTPFTAQRQISNIDQKNGLVINAEEIPIDPTGAVGAERATE